MIEFTTDHLEELVVARGLLLPRPVLAGIVAALGAGKHVMLSGPPGTGKTTLAYLTAELGRSAMRCTGHLAVTASTDWTIGDTIGRYTASPEGSVFRPGVFLDAIRAGQWLVIDELNRADFDSAFGPLFTVLAGQSVVLPYKQIGHTHPMSIVPVGAASPPNTEVIRVPEPWRMIATMNEFDKDTLHRMSHALMRRFAFVEVVAPADEVVRTLVAGPGDLVADLLPVRRFVDLGPAPFIDAARFAALRIQERETTRSRVLFESLYAYLLPQLDALDESVKHELLGLLEPTFDDPEAHELRRALGPRGPSDRPVRPAEPPHLPPRTPARRENWASRMIGTYRPSGG